MPKPDKKSAPSKKEASAETSKAEQEELFDDDELEDEEEEEEEEDEEEDDEDEEEDDEEEEEEEGEGEEEEEEEEEDEEEEEEEEEEDELPTLAAAADEGGPGVRTARKRLTEMAEKVGLDPDDYDTWADLAKAIANPPKKGKSKKAEKAAAPSKSKASQPTAPEVLAELAGRASAGQIPAANRLSSEAKDIGLDPDDYETWKGLAKAIGKKTGQGAKVADGGSKSGKGKGAKGADRAKARR